MWLSCTQYFHLLTESCVESLLLASPSPSPQLYIYISILIHVGVSIHQARCTPAPSHILPTYLFYNHKPSTLTNTHPTQSLSLSLSLTHTHTPCAAHLPLLLAISISIFRFWSQLISLLTIALMMNLVSFETPPLGRKERANTTITAKAPPRANESNSSSTCFHSHLDLSLGISLSHGGSSCCDATGCSGIKASCGGRQGGGKQTSGIQQQASVFNFIFFKCTGALPNRIA